MKPRKMYLKITHSQKIILSLAALLLLLAGLARTVSAQTQEPSDDAVNRIANQLYCPVCENIPLDVCSSQACSQWRDLIRQKLAAGWTEEQIKTYFVEQYGDRVLAEPPRRGLNWLVYILPPLFFLGGAWVLFRVLRGMRKTPASVQPAPPLAEDKDYAARLEEELRRFEKD